MWWTFEHFEQILMKNCVFKVIKNCNLKDQSCS